MLEGMGWLTKRQETNTAMPLAPVAPAPAVAPALLEAPPPRAPTTPNTLAKGTSVRGDLRGDGGFRIDGHVDGSVESGGPVTIGESGSVSGLVRGTDVTIEGTVRGDVQATGHVEVGARGRLLGDATGKSVRVAVGGVMRGMSRMGEDDEADGAAASPTPSSPALSALSGDRWLAGEHVEEIDVQNTGS